MIEWASPKEEERKEKLKDLLDNPVERSLNTINEINQRLGHKGQYDAKVKSTLGLVKTFLEGVKDLSLKE